MDELKPIVKAKTADKIVREALRERADMATVEEVGEKIREYIRNATADGFVIKPQMMQLKTESVRRCCAVGAVVTDVYPSDGLYFNASKRLSVTLEEVLDIAQGFDGKGIGGHNNPEFHGLGQQLRREVIEGTL